MEKGYDDSRLVHAYLAGDGKAFERLYKKYEKPLFSFILKFLKNRQNAEDVFQQTWIKALNGLRAYEEKGKFSSWLFGIANNCCIDTVRKLKREKIDEMVSSEALDQISAGINDPEKSFIVGEMGEWLESAVSRLPLEQRQVVLLRIYSDLPFKDIARILKSPLNTILGRMHYAVKHLQRMSSQVRT